MSVDITLRFRRPEEVMTLMGIMMEAVEDAEGCYSDNGAPSDAITMAHYKELEEALWTCLAEQGFELRYDRDIKDNKFFYEGKELKYDAEPNVSPVVEREESYGA
jgi:hypothetical protein